MRAMYYSPAEYVVKVFGGTSATARAIGRSPSCISHWLAPREQRGCGGQIPSGAQLAILTAARALYLDITERDLIRGREVSDEPVACNVAAA